MGYHGNGFLDPKEEQTVMDLKGCEIKESPTDQENPTGVTWGINTEKEEEEWFVGFEIPIIIAAWVTILITLGYFIYIGI